MNAVVESPLVTVITPSLNQGRFIRATIESVLRQEYPYLEYIIMDGGSTDETASIVKDYASRLTWISEKDRGQSHAINKGFRRAKGEIVSWLNSDDIILPGAVSTAVSALARSPSSGAVYGEGYLIDEEGKIKTRFPATESFNLWRLVYVCDYILQPATYFRKSVLAEVGYLDETLHWVMDWDILIRIGKQYWLEYVPEFLGCLREHGEAKSSLGGTKRIAEIKRMLRRHTGGSFRPGYLYYGLETYRRIWCSQIERWSPAFLKGVSQRLQRLVFVGAGYWIDWASNEAQGVLPGGWATRRVRYMLPPPRGRDVVIRGALPDAGQEQTIAVVIDNRTVATRAVNTAEFVIQVAVPEELQGRTLNLELRAARLMGKLPEGCPVRKPVCYLLREMSFA